MTWRGCRSRAEVKHGPPTVVVVGGRARGSRTGSAGLGGVTGGAGGRPGALRWSRCEALRRRGSRPPPAACGPWVVAVLGNYRERSAMITDPARLPGPLWSRFRQLRGPVRRGRRPLPADGKHPTNGHEPHDFGSRTCVSDQSATLFGPAPGSSRNHGGPLPRSCPSPRSRRPASRDACVRRGDDHRQRLSHRVSTRGRELVPRSRGCSTGLPTRARHVPRRTHYGRSSSFSRTAYMTASMREWSWSFSRMLRTWFLTVFSLM